jgi:flagellar hook-associated protein 2
MSIISFGGLASGLDTGSIVSQLLALRSQPMYRMQSQVSTYESQHQAVSVLEGYCSELQSAVQGLDAGNEFASFSAISDNESLFTATASSNATPGNFDITVNALATAQKSISQGYDSLSDSVGAGAIGFVVNGEIVNITISAGQDSLDDLKTAINNSDAGVHASIIFDGSETGGYHLVLTASETGTDSAFDVIPNFSGGTAPLFSTIETAGNAEIIIDTVTVSSQTNSISNAVTGLTLNLHSTDPGQSTALSVETDGEEIETKIQSFIDAYNTLYSYMKDQKAEGATLRGNSILRSVSNRINMIMTSSMSGADISMLYQVGIKQSEDNLLEFDSSIFQEKLSQDFEGVQNLFVSTDESDGPVYLLGLALDDMTDSIDGLFKLTTDSFDSRVDLLESSISRYQESLANYEQLLTAKFNAMEQLISGLNSQSSYLSAFTNNG